VSTEDVWVKYNATGPGQGREILKRYGNRWFAFKEGKSTKVSADIADLLFKEEPRKGCKEKPFVEGKSADSENLIRPMPASRGRWRWYGEDGKEKQFLWRDLPEEVRTLVPESERPAAASDGQEPSVAHDKKGGSNG
jgi:hypothetical protein